MSLRERHNGSRERIAFFGILDEIGIGGIGCKCLAYLSDGFGEVNLRIIGKLVENREKLFALELFAGKKLLKGWSVLLDVSCRVDGL